MNKKSLYLGMLISALFGAMVFSNQSPASATDATMKINPGFYDVTMSQDMLTASASVTLPSGFSKFTIEESWSVGTPYKAAATPSTSYSVSCAGTAFQAVATIASVSQTNILMVAPVGANKILKFTLAGATPTTTAVCTRTIHAQN